MRENFVFDFVKIIHIQDFNNTLLIYIIVSSNILVAFTDTNNILPNISIYEIGKSKINLKRDTKVTNKN